MGFDPPFAKSLAAALALLWLACIAIGLPPPEKSRVFPNLRFRPRLAVLGALAFGMLFAGIAAWEHGGVPGLEEMEGPGWEAHFEGPARTLSAGAAFLAIAVVLAGVAAWAGERSRVAARGAILFVVVLLAGAIWPVFSIPRWCAWLGAPADLPQPLPLAAYRPDYDPARWLDAWSRALHPLAPWGMGIALAGIAAGVVMFRRATARADAPGREFACAVVACAGLLAMCGACLEFEKQAAWQGHESRLEQRSDQDVILTWAPIEFRYLLLRSTLRDAVPDPPVDDLVVVKADVSPMEAPEPRPVSVSTVVWNSDPSAIPTSGGLRTFSIRSRPALSFWYSDRPPIPSEPDIGPPASTPLTWFALAVGFFAALFGEFHLRGRRLLRDPVTNLPAPEAA